jgi:tripartite-type tricarboxylate transporter receptor subunit TctC
MNQLNGYKNLRVCMARHRAVFAAIGMTLLASLGCPAGAQDASSYPSKPVRIFVPYGAGGVGDLTMRLLAQS